MNWLGCGKEAEAGLLLQDATPHICLHRLCHPFLPVLQKTDGFRWDSLSSGSQVVGVVGWYIWVGCFLPWLPLGSCLRLAVSLIKDLASSPRSPSLSHLLPGSVHCLFLLLPVLGPCTVPVVLLHQGVLGYLDSWVPSAHNGLRRLLLL